MSLFEKDPIGRAIHDYISGDFEENIIVKSSICEDDVIPVPYLFRGQVGNEHACTELELMALERCTGKILDVGGGAGIHAEILHKQGKKVEIIDTSAGAVAYHLKQGLPSRCVNFFDLQSEQYDTLLFLMNGFGIAGNLEQLPRFLEQCSKLLPQGGQILGDSTDIKYLYEDDEGGYWLDLNSAYYGNFDFQMCYKDTCTDTFDWLYVDFDTLKSYAEALGFSVEKLYEHENQYLARLVKL